MAGSRSAARWVALSVTDSPGQRLTSLSVQRTGSTGAPPAPRTCASTKNAGVLPPVVFRSVTVVVVVPSALVVLVVDAETVALAIDASPDRSPKLDVGA